MSFLVVVVILMAILTFTLNIIGRKISYSYILYTPAIVLSVGVCLYLGKLFTASTMIDLLILSILLIVWIFAIIETIIIDVFEQGREMKEDVQYLGKKLVNYFKLDVEPKHPKYEPHISIEEEPIEMAENRMEKVTQK
ncbi:hypothetical protein SAMN05880501_104100 [Ureibacillus xyleni]|uniref:Uncharacterized protein n=1 Tax=Ureibacillus xyleni TaxID=614648 RepID=A0A285SD49_9BACL|nr:hypothetical protein [Ureibacillus xyleni]SOC05715.1 hypothetical protein SAMN05880501_104100 [Ureibacillus xyleni]